MDARWQRLLAGWLTALTSGYFSLEKASDKTRLSDFFELKTHSGSAQELVSEEKPYLPANTFILCIKTPYSAPSSNYARRTPDHKASLWMPTGPAHPLSGVQWGPVYCGPDEGSKLGKLWTYLNVYNPFPYYKAKHCNFTQFFSLLPNEVIG